MAVFQMTLPDWCVAGEARKAEADLTSGGAGQYGTSEAATRAELLSGRHYLYMKAMHGRSETKCQARQSRASS